MNNWKVKFRKLVRSPWIDLVVGLLLIVAGLWEVFDTIPQDISDIKFRSQHAIILIGFVTVLPAIVDLFAGLEFIEEIDENEIDLGYYKAKL